MGSGIHVDSWVKVDERCSIEYQVAGGEAEFRLGGFLSDGVDLIFTGKALAKMAEKCAEALRQVTQDEDESDD